MASQRHSMHPPAGPSSAPSPETRMPDCKLLISKLHSASRVCWHALPRRASWSSHLGWLLCCRCCTASLHLFDDPICRNVSPQQAPHAPVEHQQQHPGRRLRSNNHCGVHCVLAHLHHAGLPGKHLFLQLNSPAAARDGIACCLSGSSCSSLSPSRVVGGLRQWRCGEGCAGPCSVPSPGL